MLYVRPAVRCEPVVGPATLPDAGSPPTSFSTDSEFPETVNSDRTSADSRHPHATNGNSMAKPKAGVRRASAERSLFPIHAIVCHTSSLDTGSLVLRYSQIFQTTRQSDTGQAWSERRSVARSLQAATARALQGHGRSERLAIHAPGAAITPQVLLLLPRRYQANMPATPKLSNMALVGSGISWLTAT